MIVAVNEIYAIAITGAILYQLSYEAIDVGSRSIVGSYVPVKDWNEC